MAARNDTRTDMLIGLAVFVGVLIVYIVTLCPSLYPGYPSLFPGGGEVLGDSLEAVAAATGTAVVKSVKYPVWLFFGRIFSFFTSNKAWALNLFSAVCGAASIALLYRIFARFAHTRIRDELLRFRGQPNLARYAALAAVLLVAFTHTFWRASVVAGMHTLNAFLLLLATHLLLRYRETRQKRYFMLYAAVYAVGMANFPTMTLLFPIFLVLSILWCREVFFDPIAIGVTLLIAAVLFAVSALAAPLGFSSNLPGYFVAGGRFRPFFDYARWYWSQIRPVFPMGGLGGAMSWVLWLVLPTLPPVIYLAFTKPRGRMEMGRGSTVTTGIFRVLAFFYTIFGLLALFDILIGPHVMVTGEGAYQTVVKQEGFLVVYIVIGGWVCYMFGYWVVLFTGRLAAASAATGAPRYSRSGYQFLVAICLLLPVASVVKHAWVDKTGLAGFTVFEDLAADTLASAAQGGERAVIFVSGGDAWGDALRYVKERGEVPGDVMIVDLYAPQKYKDYINRHAYLNAMLLGDGSTPRTLRPEFDPAQNPALTDLEAALFGYLPLASELNGTPRPKVYLTSDADRYDPGSARVDFSYEMVPHGLLYALSERDSYLNVPAEHIEAGVALWNTLRAREIEPRPLRAWPPAAALLGRRASKLSNDFGVYCHKHAGEKQAVEFYELAFRFDDLNYAALRNMKLVGEAKEGSDLDVRLNEAGNDRESQIKRLASSFFGPAATEEQKEAARKYATAFVSMSLYGLIRDPQLVDDFIRNNPNIRSRTFEFLYSLLSLKVQLDPAGDRALNERGALYYDIMVRGQAMSRGQAVQALMDFRAAEPFLEKDEEKAVAEFQVAELQLRLGDRNAAEESYKKAMALNPTLPSPPLRLADLCATTERTDEAIRLVENYMEQNPPTTPNALVESCGRLRRYYAAKEDPEGFVAFAEAYARANPPQARDIKLYLFEVARAEKQYDRAEKVIKELIAEDEDSATLQVRALMLAYDQERFADILAMEELQAADTIALIDRVLWHGMRGEAFLRDHQFVRALDELKTTYGFMRQQEAQRQTVPAAVRRSVYQLRWAAAMRAAEATSNPDIENEALAYAEEYSGFARQINSEQDRILAAAFRGWTLFKLKHDVKAAMALIEPAALALPENGMPKYYLGVILIETGDIARGVALVQQALELDLSVLDEEDAKALLEKYKDYIVEEPAEPAEPETDEESAPVTTPAAPEGLSVDTEADTSEDE